MGQFGGSLEVLYELPKGGNVAVSSSLAGLDISQAQYFIARVHQTSWDAYKGKIQIVLKDTLKHEARVELTAQHVKIGQGGNAGWYDIQVPVKKFPGLDFNRLDSFQLVLKNEKTSERGSLVFDEFAFFGVHDLFFESAKDNLESFPVNFDNRLRAETLLREEDEKRFLTEIARDTWKYFEAMIDRETGLVSDHVRLGSAKGVGNYTSTTNIALDWLSTIAAFDLKFISKENAIAKIERSLKTLESLAKWKGFYYNYYQTRTLSVTRRYISTVDNGWIFAAAVILRQAFPGVFNERMEKMLQGVDFKEFYDDSNGQLKLGYDEETESHSPYHYGLLVSEARLTSYLAIAKGDLDKSHWARIYRTLPKEWDWQTQVPEGVGCRLFGTALFEGYYLYEDQKIVPSWGGSLFEFISPSIILNEQKLGTHALAVNNKRAVEIHMNYALKTKKYPVWGIAPAALQNGRQWVYREFGIKEIASKGYPEEGVVSPYASALAVEIKPNDVVSNFRKMMELYPEIYGPYGFYDSVDTVRSKVTKQYLALDQGLLLLALSNYLTDGAIRNRFHQDKIGKEGEELLTEEHFFTCPDSTEDVIR